MTRLTLNFIEMRDTQMSGKINILPRRTKKRPAGNHKQTLLRSSLVIRGLAFPHKVFSVMQFIILQNSLLLIMFMITDLSQFLLLTTYLKNISSLQK